MRSQFKQDSYYGNKMYFDSLNDDYQYAKHNKTKQKNVNQQLKQGNLDIEEIDDYLDENQK